MSSKLLINAVDREECRIAKVKESKLEEFHIESASKEITHGNIYKAVITRVEPSLQAVFVDYGAQRHGFLQKHEIHSDYYQDNASGDQSIKQIVKRGQELLVQVTKDPFMKKGAMLTTFISLAGRYLVLMPGSENRGISRKIEDEDERNRLKEIITKLKLPIGFGIIVRTAGVACTKTLLSKDLKYLMRLWKTIKKSVMKEKAPCLLYKERNLVLRSIRDYFTPDITEILIDDSPVFTEVKSFIKIISSKHAKIVRLYKGDKPIFTKYQLESQIASIFESRVLLKSGGSIVIEPTEAMVSIDVNSGKATRKKSIEQTALLTNIEAAEEITRQLRLRDLGGLIVIDFIDMKDQKHRLDIERTVKTHVKNDKARTQVGRISKFGLMEMSRQRIRPTIEFGSFEPCKFCLGKGLTPSTETLVLRFIRKLRLETLENDISSVKGIVPSDVADYLLNKKRKEILDLELNRNINIAIEADSSMIPGESNIICEK
ncbi:MAG: Rne/Rng family ribonuclease [Deltaproteobacteria bacterium]|nr:Rne/Rng family ribonuclease [Deltaproteobacteria bacterium]